MQGCKAARLQGCKAARVSFPSELGVNGNVVAALGVERQPKVISCKLVAFPYLMVACPSLSIKDEERRAKNEERRERSMKRAKC